MVSAIVEVHTLIRILVVLELQSSKWKLPGVVPGDFQKRVVVA